MKSLPTLRDVAREANVSLCTASNALRGAGRLSVLTRDKVRSAAERLGYATDPVLASALSKARKQQTQQDYGAIGLLISTQAPEALVRNDGQQCVRAIEQTAAAHGYRVDRFFPDRDYGDSPERLVSIIKSRGLAGCISVEIPHAITMGSRLREHLREALPGLPLVSASKQQNSCWFGWSVGIDHFQSGYSCIEHAFEAGYHRPGVVTSVTRYGAVDEFTSGCMQALHRFLPMERVPPYFSLDHRQPRTVEEARDWLRTNEIDCVISSAVDVLRKRLKSVAKLPPVISMVESQHSERHGLHAVMCEDWPGIGRTACELLLGAMQMSSLSQCSQGCRVLVPGVFRVELKPPRLKTKRFGPLSLKAHVNTRVAETGGWFSSHLLPLFHQRCLHRASEIFTIEFETRPPSRVSAKAVHFLSSSNQREGCFSELMLPIPASIRRARTFHFLLGCGFARSGDRMGTIEIFGKSPKPILTIPLIAAGRDGPDRAANIQDWWPHTPILENAVPVYDPEDRTYQGYLYHLQGRIGGRSMPIRIRITSNPDVPSTLMLLGVSAELPLAGG